MEDGSPASTSSASGHFTTTAGLGLYLKAVQPLGGGAWLAVGPTDPPSPHVLAEVPLRIG